MEKEDEGPGLGGVGVRGVGWGKGDVVLVAEGGVGFALVEELEGDVGGGGMAVAGVFGDGFGCGVGVGHCDVMGDVLGASFRAVEGVKGVWVDAGVFAGYFTGMAGWRHVDIRAEQGRGSDFRAESHVYIRLFVAVVFGEGFDATVQAFLWRGRDC